jgi:hypothetical protein
MIFSMNEKWIDSSILTKAATFAMALNLVLTLVCDIIMIAWGLAGFGTIIWYLICLIVIFLLALGLFKVNRAARIITSLLGFFSALLVVGLILSFNAASSMSGGIMSMLFGLISALIPDEAKALMALFAAPYVLTILAWLLLLVCGRDFKKKEISA